MKNYTLRYTQYGKEKYLLAFVLGAATLLAALLPIMVCEHGYFIYYGDYIAQQIPFYNLANDTVRAGQFGWNWFTDMGSDFLTSYSFYLIGSPFFWLTTILPRAAVSYSLPFLLALKHGMASLTAYAYIRRFVRSKEAALVGAMLYAFSGFQLFNIFFNHFQDVTALFPLMLIALEENINNRRRGWFALIVALMASINYFFFTGEAVFLVIYFLIRIPCSDFRASWRGFFRLLLEAIVGTAIAGIILLPSALAILSNYRVSERLYGENMVLYHIKARALRVVQNFFLPTEVPARTNLFKSENAKWASVGGYFPLFGMLGVITYLRSRKRNWAVRLSVICIICSMVPILNSMFYTFNASYYARWFFMPILIFAMMTAQTLDDDEANFRPAIMISGAVILAFGLISFIPEKIDDKVSWFTFPADMGYFWFTTGIAIISLIAAALIIRLKKHGRPYTTLMLWATTAACLVCTMTTVIYGAMRTKDANDYINMAVRGKDGIHESVDEDNFFRIDISLNNDNFPMFWNLPTIQCFQSVVSTSIMDFYEAIGVQRDVSSEPDKSHYTLEGLLSIKYYYNEKDEVFDYKTIQRYKSHASKNSSIAPFESTSVPNLDANAFVDDAEDKVKKNDIPQWLPGFEYVDTNDYYDIFENTLYIPMGMGYDTYVSREDADKKTAFAREKMMISTLIMDDDQIEKYSDILTEAPLARLSNMTKSDYEEECRKKQQCCSESFSFDSHHFESEITLDKPQLVFFSVPYSEGWTAEVNGKPVDVEKVNYGFMAVRAEEGHNSILFRYTTPGLKGGIIMTVSGAALLILYLVIFRLIDKKSKPVTPLTHSYQYTSCQKITAHEVYSRNAARRAVPPSDTDKE